MLQPIAANATAAADIKTELSSRRALSPTNDCLPVRSDGRTNTRRPVRMRSTPPASIASSTESKPKT
jgi:hypothetical protein